MKRVIILTTVLIVALTVLFLIPSSSVVSKEAHAQAPEPEPSIEQPSFSVIQAEVSAYTSSPDETDGNPNETASGTVPENGTIACPARFAFGTWVEINGKKYVCEDRMNARYRHGNYFDVWMESKSLAYQWGRRIVDVKIYE